MSMRLSSCLYSIDEKMHNCTQPILNGKKNVTQSQSAPKNGSKGFSTGLDNSMHIQSFIDGANCILGTVKTLLVTLAVYLGEMSSSRGTEGAVALGLMNLKPCR